MRRPHHHDQRALLLGRAFQLGHQGALAAGRHGLIGNGEPLDDIGRARAPIGGIGQDAPFREGLGRRQGLGAIDQRLPVGQARADLFHMLGIGPALVGIQAKIADVDDLAAVAGLDPIVADVVGPDLQARRQRAVGQRRELREVARGDVFHLIAGALQDLAGDARGDVLAGPLIERQLDRLVGRAELGRIDLRATQAQGQTGGDGRSATYCFP